MLSQTILSALGIQDESACIRRPQDFPSPPAQASLSMCMFRRAYRADENGLCVPSDHQLLCGGSMTVIFGPVSRFL